MKEIDILGEDIFTNPDLKLSNEQELLLQIKDQK